MAFWSSFPGSLFIIYNFTVHSESGNAFREWIYTFSSSTKLQYRWPVYTIDSIVILSQMFPLCSEVNYTEYEDIIEFPRITESVFNNIIKCTGVRTESIMVDIFFLSINSITGSMIQNIYVHQPFWNWQTFHKAYYLSIK